MFLHQTNGRKNFIEVISEEVTSLRDSIDFLLDKKKYESIYVERGVTSMFKYFQETNKEVPFDLFILTVYNGEVKLEFLPS